MYGAKNFMNEIFVSLKVYYNQPKNFKDKIKVITNSKLEIVSIMVFSSNPPFFFRS